MRFHVGGPPVDETFQPEQSGWTPMREPSPLMLNLMALPMALGVLILLQLAWGSDGNVVGPSGNRTPPSSVVLIVSAVIGVPLLILVHELLHAVVYPRAGRTRDTVIGAWPSRFLFYALYLKELSRNRWLLVYVMPFLVLSIAPLVVCRLVGLKSVPCMVVSLVNGLFSSGDLVIVGLILWQIPRDALMRNKGWATWWIPASSLEGPSTP
jgi:hypothetical protein